MIKRNKKWNHKKSLKTEYNRILKFKKKLYIIKILFLFFLFILFFSIYIFNNNNYNNKNINESKVCICTLAKQENLYIREYLEHYKNYGVNKIYLYDNNDIDGEKIEDVVSVYIKSGLVEISNWRGEKKVQYKIINECYQKHKEEYDWVMFSEIDEFIHLYKNYTKVITFLNEPKFNKCEIIHLNLVSHTDNEQLHYENKPLKERFPKIVPTTMKGGKHLEIKFILRGHLNNTSIYCLHRGNYGLKDCDGFGQPNKYESIYTKEPDTTYYYYDHYYGKSTEEFAKKVKRGYGEFPDDQFRMGRIKKYFEDNTLTMLTMEKILMIEKETKLDLSSYKHKISN